MEKFKLITIAMAMLLLGACDEELPAATYCKGIDSEGRTVDVKCNEGISKQECEQMNEQAVDGLNWSYGEGDACPLIDPPDPSGN